jgi:hypothetical protein
MAPVEAGLHQSNEVDMKHSEFKIGGEFTTGSGRWRCTDVGSRVIVAIKLDKGEDTSWYNGPPYAVAESVFDEYGFGGCEPAVSGDQIKKNPQPDAEIHVSTNPMDKHDPDWVWHALWCMKDGGFLQVAEAFTQLVEGSNDWEELKSDPLLLLLVHRIYQWCSSNASRDLLYRLVMASDSDLGVEIDSDACQMKVYEWMKGKGATP